MTARITSRIATRITGTTAALALAATLTTGANAQSINDYFLSGTFDLPLNPVTDANDFDNNVLFDVLPDGTLLIINEGNVTIAPSTGTGTLLDLGAVAGYDAALFGPSYIEASPDGSQALLGLNGFGTLLFDVADPTQSTFFSAADFDAVWLDNTTAVLSNSEGVQLFDTTTGTATTIINNIGGGSAGIVIGPDGTLYTGNGFDSTPPNDTGLIAAFSAASIAAAASSGIPLDFQADGTPVADLLSAGSLAFDQFGNLLVSGADFFSGGRDFGYAAIIDAAALSEILTDPASNPIINVDTGPADLLQITVPQDTIDNFQPPSWTVNEATGELYLSFFNSQTVFVYAIPAPGTAALAIAGLAAASRRRRAA